MDKLKPILVHKFWIILFIALLLPVVGWSMATGKLATEIEERKKAIDQAFTAAQVPSNPPNQTWSTALQQINKEKDYSIGLSWKKLWDKQQSLFVWPPDITPLMKNTPYRGDISRVPRNLYRSAYKFEILRAHKLADPFSLRDGTGTVDINPNVLPHVPLDTWKTLPPSSKEMWDAQEDVWLVSSILKAIANVNKGASNISESAVRQISVLELRGGTFGEEGGGDSGGGEGGEPGMAGEMAGGGLFGGGGGRPASNRGKDGAQSIDIEMDLSEIFGNDADTSGGGDEGSGEGEPADAGLIPGGFGAGSGQGAAKNRKRYYQEAEELPYKTRAFYIKAVIQSGKLPNLIAELTNMPWPAEIVRVQRADAFDDNLSPIADIGGGGGGGRSRGAGGEVGFSVEGSFGGAGGGRAGGFGATSEGQPEGLENKGLLDAALNDPQLAVVTIAGVMTLYKPYVAPEGEVVAELEGGAEGDSKQPAPDGTTQPSDAATTESEESPANSNPPAGTPNATPEKEPAPAENTAGDSPQQPTESTEPKQPADTKPDDTQPPKTEPKSAETTNQ